jgi:hypothetical protein
VVSAGGVDGRGVELNTSGKEGFGFFCSKEH